jgi:hypothetical protein
MSNKSQVYGKITIGWSTVCVLPIVQAAQLVELIGTGIFRENGNYPDKGLTRFTARGRAVEVPSIEVITAHEYDVLLQAGTILQKKEAEAFRAELEAERAKLAAEQAKQRDAAPAPE